MKTKITFILLGVLCALSGNAQPNQIDASSPPAITGTGNTIVGGAFQTGASADNNNTWVGSGTGSPATPELTTFLGYGAGTTTAGLSNATAIGSNAQVTASNNLILGDLSTYTGIGLNQSICELQIVNGTAPWPTTGGGNSLPPIDILKLDLNPPLCGTLSSVTANEVAEYATSFSTNPSNLGGVFIGGYGGTVSYSSLNGGLLGAAVGPDACGNVGLTGVVFGQGAFMNIGVHGAANPDDGSFNIGTLGEISGTGSGSAGFYNIGIWGICDNSNNSTSNTTTNWGAAGNNNNWAGQFEGDILVDGTPYSTAGGPFLVSDEKLKTDITPYGSALEALQKLNVKTYKFRTEEYKGLNFPPETQIGLLAQEVGPVFPQLLRDAHVSVRSGAKYEFETLNYSGFIPVLIEAVNELNNKTTDNSTLQNQLNALQQANQDLQTKTANLENLINDVCASGCDKALENFSAVSASQGADRLFQNIPNPANGATIIKYSVVETTKTAWIYFHALDGSKIASYEVPITSTGALEIQSGTLASGTYTYTLIVDGNNIVDTKIMVVAK